MAGDLRRLRGDRDKKKRSSLYRSCLHERVILPDYRITSLLQFIHHFYNTFTTLLRPVHHFYNTFASLLHHLYITFTSFLQLIRHFHPLCGTVAKLAMRQPFVLFKGLTFQKLCLPGAFRPGDHHNKMLRPGLCVVHASPQYL